MIRNKNYSFARVSKHFLLVLAVLALASDVRASNIPSVWRILYKEIEGSAPNWTSTSDAEAWAKKEAHQLAPIVEDMLTGNRSGVNWATGAYVARIVSSPKIRDIMVQRLEEVANDFSRQPFNSTSPEVIGTTHAIRVLRRASDVRIIPISLKLLAVENLESNVAEQAVRALGKLGGKECLPHIKNAPLRKHNETFDGRCRLAEKIITKRMEGQDIFADANEELTRLVEKYVSVARDENVDEYFKLHRFGLRRMLDTRQVQREHFGSDELVYLLHELPKLLSGRMPYVFDTEELSASLTVGERFRMTFDMEVDGWKIGALERIR